MMLQSEQINELAIALAKAQGSMENATMNRVNPHFKSKYADLGSVLDAIRQPLSTNGLSIIQQIKSSSSMTESGLILRTILMHSSGQFIASEYPLPIAQTQQAMGSALTYARRYCIAALVCNASDEDDDANGTNVVIAANIDPSRARFIEECEASIERIGGHPNPTELLIWWNSEAEKKKRRDFDLSPAEVAHLKERVTAKSKRAEG